MVKKLAVPILIIVVLSSLLLGGCLQQRKSPQAEANAGQNTNEATKQVQLHILSNRVDLIENGSFEQYADAFEAQHPGVKLIFEGLSNYVSDISARLSTQDYGDVLLIPNHMKTEDLEDYFEPLPDSLFENIRFADYKSYNGERYGITTGSSATGIVYNKQAFEKAGIDKVPTTLDEFYEACRKLKQAGITPIYLNYGAQWPLMNWGEELVSVMNGDAGYLNSLVEQDAPWQLDNEWGQSISIVKTLIEQNYVERALISNQWEASKLEFVEGRAGMYFLGNWIINQLIALGADPETIGFFPFPYRNEQPVYSPLNPDWFIAISKYSQHKELALEWIKYFVHESGFVDDSGFLPIDTTKEPTLPQYKEFLSYGSILVERQIPSDALLEIADAAQITFWSGLYIQEWIAAPDLQEAFQQYNERWAEARKLLQH